MKIVIFNSELLWTPHFGTGLELMEQHLLQKHEVHHFVCNSFLKECDQNMEGNHVKCELCIKKREMGVMGLVQKPNEVLIEFQRKNWNVFKPNMTLDEVKAIQHKNFDVGMAVVSSVVSRKRDAHLNVSQHATLLNTLINNGISLYEYFLQKLETLNPNLVYIFNGRLMYDKALLKACEQLNIDYYVYERGSSVDKYMLFHKATPHNIDYIVNNIHQTWETSSLPVAEKEQLAKDFFEQRMHGTLKNWHFYTGAQQKDLLPNEWDNKQRNIGVFLSSEDEFVAIGDQWKMPIYPDQLSALKKLKEAFSSNDQIHFYIRIHPNSNGTSKGLLKKIQELNDLRFTIIPANSKISTYALMLGCEKVVSFGSTIGIEATFWGKPSICLGQSYYRKLDVTYNANNHEEAVTLINSIKMNAIKSDNTLKYGLYFHTYGIKYQYFQPYKISGGSFKDIPIGTIEYSSVPGYKKKKNRLLTIIKGFLPSEVKLKIKNIIKK
jgi:hypothetical protein